jgi:hypothetical protein
MSVIKKTTLSVVLMLSCLITGQAMAAACPSASDFEGLKLMGTWKGNYIWSKMGADTSGQTVTYSVTTRANESYKDVMASAQSRHLRCRGVPSSATICSYHGPHLQHELGCNDIKGADHDIGPFPVDTALAIIY